MIPAKFDYVRPGSLDEAVRALADGGEDAKIIAGGQSLLPLLRLRLANPELLIGARTTHYQLIHDPLVAEPAGCWPRAPARSPIPPSGTGHPRRRTGPRRPGG